MINKEVPVPFVFEDQKMIVIKDIHPQAPIHLLIVPKKHIDSVVQLKKEDRELIQEMIWRAKLLAEENNIAEGGYKLIFNSGENAIQAIKHLHLHLLGGKKMQWPV